MGYDFQYIFENKTTTAKRVITESGVWGGNGPDSPDELDNSSNDDRFDAEATRKNRAAVKTATELVKAGARGPSAIFDAAKAKGLPKEELLEIQHLLFRPSGPGRWYDVLVRELDSKNESTDNEEETTNGPHLDFDNIEVELMIHALRDIADLEPDGWEEGELNEIPALIKKLKGETKVTESNDDNDEDDKAMEETVTPKKLADLYK